MLLKLINFKEKHGKTQALSEEWKLELPLEFKTRDITTKMNNDFIAFMLIDPKTSDKVIYLYEIMTQRYIGFINLT